MAQEAAGQHEQSGIENPGVEAKPRWGRDGSSSYVAGRGRESPALDSGAQHFDLERDSRKIGPRIGGGGGITLKKARWFVL